MVPGNLLMNRQMTKLILANGYSDAATALAMEKIDRGLFVPEALRSSAYEDRPLPIGHGQTISAPGIVALMCWKLDVKEGMRVLEVGTGSGYQTAILAELVGERGRVVTTERIPELVENAKENIAKLPKHGGYKNIEFLCCDGTLGAPERAPYDRISVTAAAPSIPEPLVSQLAPEGKLIVPVGKYFQDLLLYDKKSGAIINLLPVVFVPLLGEHGFEE